MVGRSIVGELNAIHEIFAPSHQELDLLDFSTVRKFVSDVKPDLIIHAAGRVGGIKKNIDNQYNFCRENLLMGQNLVFAADGLDIGAFVNIGTACMYPKGHDLALKEDDLLSGPLEPTNEGYAIAKLTVMKLGEYLNQKKGSDFFKTIIPCNLYGPNDSFDLYGSHMVPSAIAKIHTAKAKNETDVEIWGDGESKREFMFITDLARCITMIVSRFKEMPVRMNCGLGCDYSINEYYVKIAEIVGYDGSFVHDLSKPVGMRRKLLDSGRAIDFGWKPQFGLDDGLKLTYDFYTEQVIGGHGKEEH